MGRKKFEEENLPRTNKLLGNKMEIKEHCEVPIYGSPHVTPGYYYDHKIRHFSQPQDFKQAKIEKINNMKWKCSRKNFIENLRANKSLCGNNWVTDYVKEKPLDAILIEGVKYLEERALDVPEASEMCRVLSVLYKYNANLLLCFDEGISDDEWKTFQSNLSSTLSSSSYSVFSPSLVNKFICGYIYPKYSNPGIRFEKFMYGVKEFCLMLQESSAISTIPISAIVETPTESHNTGNSARVTGSVSEGIKANVKSEPNIEFSLETKNTVGTSNSDNIAIVHSKGLLNQSSAGHGITKCALVKGEIGATPEVKLGRGRGVIGRGNTIPVIQKTCTTRIGENRTREPFMQNKECTTRVGENRTRELDHELKQACDNLFEELGNNREVSPNFNSDNIKEVTGYKNVVNVEQGARFDGPKLQNSMENNKRYREVHEERKAIDKVSNYNLAQPNASSLSVSRAQNSLMSENSTDHHCQARGLSSSCDNQSNEAEQNNDQVVNGENICSKLDVFNDKSTFTMSGECNKTLQEDNVNKSEKGSQEFENSKKAIMSIRENSLDKTESGVQLSEKSKCSASYSEIHEDSNDNPACNARSANAKKGTLPANEPLRSNIKKSEFGCGKSHDTKEKDTSKSKVTVKESNLKSVQRQKCNSTISENAEKKIGRNKEIRKSKNSENKNPPNIHSQVETNTARQKELFQGMMCNEDQDDKLFLKIGKQDNCKVQICKEKPQMKSTFLEADKTADDMLGFQRKYYGVVNDTSLEKVILLLGASGSGKTTLVNLAANYFKEKKSADEELYHVVTTSPTSEITAYTFCSAPDEIPITIIDTPGLNDSSGAEVRDHIQSLKTFLANASASEFQIHAIGFVAQAYLVRLTSSERLVMDYVSTIFGQGVKDHLITLVTFADNQDNPPVVEAMKNYGVSFKLSLKFNNSALHNNKAEEVDDIDRVYWRICWRNWKKCMKTLRDLSPLSVSTMKAVHSEVFASIILKSTERDLGANLKTFFGYSKEDRISSKESSKVVAEIWNLAAVLHHFRSVNNGLHSKHEDILIEFGTEICKEKQISAKENICFLSLGPETPLIVSGLQVIQTMASLYKQSKSWHTKSNTLSRNITEWTYCHHCHKNHNMNRLERGTLKKLARWEEDVVALKCTNCKCPGDVHGVSETKSPFHPDIVLDKTYTALQNVIRQYSIPNFPITEDWYLKFLNQLCLEHTDFIKAIFDLIKK